jgi:hypothetical protein
LFSRLSLIVLLQFFWDGLYKGGFVGTFDVSDGNSPIHYDHIAGEAWEILAIGYHAGIGYGIGKAPWVLEGAPKCHGGKLLIPYDGGITTILDGVATRRVFA